ncbi:MAG: hypothetical protein KC503_09080 [Myxococcales bacterium]|nr:hypothetical protein [Myxococcales bacterium]
MRTSMMVGLLAGLLCAGCSDSSAPAGENVNKPRDGGGDSPGDGPPITRREGGAPDIPGGDITAPPPPPATCQVPITLADTTSPTQRVGSGTPASCTAAALASAVQNGGVITFNCGAAPATIAITQTITIPTDKDTVIDGGGTVTLDGEGKVRIFEAVHPDYRKNTKTLTLQRLTLIRGKATGTDFTPQDPQNPDCAHGYKDGGGGALLLRDMVLHVIDCSFVGNQAASPGPDVGGGAIYATGSLEITIVGSSFKDNQGSNGGAVGLLQSTGTFVNVTFDNNRATGSGQNYVKAGCPGVGHMNQGGAGGNGGAISIDGADDLEQRFCGVTFTGNRCNELGGCVFRTANGQRRKATFEKSILRGNTAGKGGGCLYISNSDFTLSQSLVADNIVEEGSGGGVRTELNTLANIVNTTFVNNSSPKGLMGALSHNGGGEIRNCTFANNKAEGGAGLFTAALGPGGAVKVYNTVFWNNTTKEPYNPQACWHQPKQGADNFQWPRKRSDGKIDDTACVENINWQDAQLGALADNGGPTQTMLPASGSPVIGAGKSCPAVDQRGNTRPQNNCAAGAVEP